MGTFEKAISVLTRPKLKFSQKFCRVVAKLSKILQQFYKMFVKLLGHFVFGREGESLNLMFLSLCHPVIVYIFIQLRPLKEVPTHLQCKQSNVSYKEQVSA